MVFKQKNDKKTLMALETPPPINGKSHEKLPHFLEHVPYEMCNASKIFQLLLMIRTSEG